MYSWRCIAPLTYVFEPNPAPNGSAIHVIMIVCFRHFRKVMNRKEVFEEDRIRR